MIWTSDALTRKLTELCTAQNSHLPSIAPQQRPKDISALDTCTYLHLQPAQYGAFWDNRCFINSNTWKCACVKGFLYTGLVFFLSNIINQIALTNEIIFLIPMWIFINGSQVWYVLKYYSLCKILSDLKMFPLILIQLNLFARIITY